MDDADQRKEGIVEYANQLRTIYKNFYIFDNKGFIGLDFLDGIDGTLMRKQQDPAPWIINDKSKTIIHLSQRYKNSNLAIHQVIISYCHYPQKP